MAGLIITNAHVFTGRGDIIERGHVVVEGDRIVEVGSGSAAARPGFEVVDAQGGWLVPGFIDAHVHLCYAHLGDSSATDEEGLAAGRENAKAKLLSGVTTVRDLGAFHQLNLVLKAQIDRGEVIGPRMIASGDFLATPTGHCSYWARQVSGAEDVGAGVREQLIAGAEVIKVMASAGVADSGEDPESQQLDLHELTVAVTEAARGGASVAAHAHPETAIRAAIMAGCSTIEHGTFLSEAVNELMVDRGVALIPTLAVYHRMARGVDGDVKGTSALAAAIWEEKIPRLRAAIAHGVTVGVGTDSGSNFPADGYAKELELMSGLGMSAAEVLTAATAGNAAILGISDETGSIAPGLAADLVLLGGSPLEDVSHCRDVRMVVASGKTYPLVPIHHTENN